MTTTPLRRVLRPRESTGHSNLTVLSVYRDHGVIPKDSRTDNYNKTPDDLSRYQRVNAGDLVVNKMKAWSGSVGVSKYVGIVSPDYLVCEVSAEVNADYLHHWLRSGSAIAEMRSRSRGIRPSQERLYWEDLAAIHIPLPPVTEQQRIADFLDEQVALLNRSFELRRAQVELLIQRRRAVLSTLIEGLFVRNGSMALRRVAEGIEQGTSPDCYAYPADGGSYGVLKVSAVRGGEFRPEENKALPPGIEPELRYLVKAGDLLMTRGSGSRELVGDVAVATSTEAKLLLPDLIYRVRLQKGINPHYVSAAVRSPRLREDIVAATRGAVGGTIKLRGDDILDLHIPRASPVEADQLVDRWRAESEHMNRVQAAAGRQLELLSERKQALITAAVSGQLDVTTARAVA